MHGGGRCANHPSAHKEHDQRRGTSNQRGYGYRWQKASKAFLELNPLCRYCQQNNRITAATTVDHIIPHRGDPVLFWDETNWQGLCGPCHNSTKQSQEKNSSYPQ